MWISSCSLLANEVATENHPGKFRSCVSVYFNLQSIESTVLIAHSRIMVELEAECNDGLGKPHTSTQRGNLLGYQPLLPAKQADLLEPSTIPVTLWAGKRLPTCNLSPLQFLIKRPWQIQGGGTEQWWLHSMLWAGTSLVARFSSWSSLRCTGYVITSSHVTWTQHPLRAAAPTGCSDGAMCALGEQIVLNPN